MSVLFFIMILSHQPACSYKPPVSLASCSGIVVTNSEESTGTAAKDCLQNDLTEEQKLAIILNFRKFNPFSTYSYTTKSKLHC